MKEVLAEVGDIKVVRRIINNVKLLDDRATEIKYKKQGMDNRLIHKGRKF